MGNKQSKGNGIKHAKKDRKSSLNDTDTFTTSVSSQSNNKQHTLTYAEVLKLIEDELLNYVAIDLSGLILSFIPRSTIGDETNPINPYDVLNVHVHLISPYSKIPTRILSIFNLLSPNCHCGAVLSYMEYQARDCNNKSKQLECDRCYRHIGINKMATNCYNPYFECPAIDNNRHSNSYITCERCTYDNIEIYQENDGDLFSAYYEPRRNSSFDTDAFFSTLKTQRRVCLAFTDDYVRVYLHCFPHPSSNDHNDFCKALFTHNHNWRLEKNTYDLNETQIGILLDDLSEDYWDERGKYWMDYMEVWSGGSHDSIYTALCHCNQINNKITSVHRNTMESYLSHKQMETHSNMHDKSLRKPWLNLSPKLFQCSITENEDTITAILDIVGDFLSSLNDQQKLKLTYRGKFRTNNK